ncbi:MAG: ATP cone domain-containing protein, partial [Pyrobaculum sp.]
MSVVKLDGRREAFSVEKLRGSVERAAAEVGVSIDGVVDFVVDREVGSWELADMVHVELLRGA